ncbi:MAG: transposase [Xanthomonadales bacterium]|nr:transposase [Xanthomonadales bacterium]
MSRYRYSPAQKLEAVQRVVRDGRSVADVAREMRVGEGSVFFWVRRYREMVAKEGGPHGGIEAILPRRSEAHFEGEGAQPCGSLVAWLRRGIAA